MIKIHKSHPPPPSPQKFSLLLDHLLPGARLNWSFLPLRIQLPVIAPGPKGCLGRENSFYESEYRIYLENSVANALNFINVWKTTGLDCRINNQMRKTWIWNLDSLPKNSVWPVKGRTNDVYNLERKFISLSGWVLVLISSPTRQSSAASWVQTYIVKYDVFFFCLSGIAKPRGLWCQAQRQACTNKWRCGKS